MFRVIILFFALLHTSLCLADTFATEASYKVCFTPALDCTQTIVTAINQAQKQILVQAYSFTSAPIARALLQASKRGIEVKILLDKSQSRQRGFSPAKLFADYHIPVAIDYKPSIAHNKVMIIDSKTVITGSFNFTRAAQEKNAENVLIITDAALAQKYKQNWMKRAEESEPLEENL
jgi:phosphatidylserine/phosphatidylglycerophosphate/cardiolipin synthase-like enzyme